MSHSPQSGTESKAYAQFSPLYAIHNHRLREWHHPQWAGSPTLTKAIKVIPTDILAGQPDLNNLSLWLSFQMILVLSPLTPQGGRQPFNSRNKASQCFCVHVCVFPCSVWPRGTRWTQGTIKRLGKGNNYSGPETMPGPYQLLWFRQRMQDRVQRPQQWGWGWPRHAAKAKFALTQICG